MSVRYAFCGNRFFVLEAMLAAGLSVPHIAAVAGSYLEKALQEKRMAFTPLGNKRDFLAWLDTLTSETLLANGCPYIIPADRLGVKRRCINIHPSYLPDLRGADPVPGAILFGRDAGATCHVIDAGIDTGDIISQVCLPYDDAWDARQLYPLSFQAEVEAFRLALARNFAPERPQKTKGGEIYYSFKPEDLQLDLSAPAEDSIRRVRAFNTPGKLARLRWEGKEYAIAAVDSDSAGSGAEEGAVVRAGQSIVVHKEGRRLVLHIAA